MTDLKDAYYGINSNITNIINPLVEDKTIKEFVVGIKQKGMPQPPALGWIPEDMMIDDTMLGSTGQREAWNYTARLRSLVKSTNDPVLGMTDAVDVLSKARNLILTTRNLGLPQIVRQIESTKITPIPFPIGKKMSLYAADCTFKILFYITND